MSYLLIISILLPMTLMSPGCSQGRSSTNSAWSVELKTSGGFAGRGNGNVLINSQGDISYQKPSPAKNQPTTCKGAVSKDDLRKLAEAVAAAEPEHWQVQGLNAAAPDAFGYELSLSRANQTYHLKWFDNTQDLLPGDVKNLYAIVNTVKEKQSKKCDEKE